MVSICCITYNHEDYLAEAIESFLMQKTNFEYEILIGEDCSTDNTRSVVEKYVELYPNKIRLITSEMNVGAKKNSIRLYENAKGKYIALCEGDDFWISPNKLQKQVDYLEKHPECTMCFHAATVVNPDNSSAGSLVRPYKKDSVCSIETIILGGGAFFPTASLLFPKVFIETLPEFYLDGPVGDYPLAMILVSQGYAYYIDEIMSAYRTGVNVSWTNQNMLGEEIRSKHIKNFENDISILEGFDKYSKYKFNEVISKVISEKQVYIMLFQRKTVKNSEYYTYFKRMKFKKKIKIILFAFYPEKYIKLAKIIKQIQSVFQLKEKLKRP